MNGVEKTTKQNPNKSTAVTLGGLDTTDELTVEVRLTLRDGSKLYVRRSYVQCT